MTNKITKDMAGCWLDGRWGWTNAYRVIEKAWEWGFKTDPADDRLVAVYRLSNDEEAVLALLREELGEQAADASEEALIGEARSLIEVANEAVTGQGELSDRATDYLDSLAPEGMAFHWDDGLALMCLCQIEGTEENMALLKTDKYYCEWCAERYGS
jgi:hypothetical protein